MTKKSLYFIILYFIFNVFPNPVTAKERMGSKDAVLSLQVENDLFADGSDKHFTNGVRIVYVFPEAKPPEFSKGLLNLFGLTPEAATGAARIHVAAGHNMYTPDDITVAELIPEERPYAGWLYGELGATVQNGRVMDKIVLSLGVVGPASLAEDLQKTWHRWINSPVPQGWDNQIKNEPALLVTFERAWLTRHDIAGPALQLDFIPKAGIALGNVFTYGSLGGMVRFGPHLPDDFGSERIRPSLGHTGFFDARAGKFDWYLFAGAESRVMVRNIFLDGNSYRNSHSVAKKRFISDFTLGAATTFDAHFPVKLSYTLVIRTRNFKTQKQPDTVGSINFSVRF